MIKALITVTIVLIASVGLCDDFDVKCAQPGVTLCNGFNNTDTDILAGVNTISEGSGPAPTLDTDIKLNGAGSLKITRPSEGSSGVGYFTTSLGDSFGEGETFYYQYAQRFSPEMFSNYTVWTSSWKQSILYGGTSTCQSMELTTVRYNYGSASEHFPSMYTNCGGKSVYTTCDRTSYKTSSPPFLIEQGASDSDGYNGPYNAGCEGFTRTPGDGSGNGYFAYPENTWVLFYYKVQFGTIDQPDSVIEAWVSVDDGASWKQWINMPNYEFDSGGSSSFSRIELNNYMTGQAAVECDEAYVWYDDLIVSTEPITDAVTQSISGVTIGQLDVE